MSPFRPPSWLAGAHRQTVGAHFLRSRRGIAYRRERWTLPDGDFLDLDFIEVEGATWADLGSSAPIGLIIHGLGGGSESGYVWETGRQLARLGVRPVAMNCRGSSGSPNIGDRLYHAGDDEDPGFVIEGLLKRFPDVPLGVVGYSLGGSMLLNYLGRRGGGVDGRLAVAAAVSSPLDLAACAVRIEQGASKLYSRWLLMKLRTLLRARGPLSLGDFEGAMKARTIRDFDEAIIAPVHGFANADDYYARSSAAQQLPSIRVSTLLVRSLDDPFLDARDTHGVEEGEHLSLRVGPRGGHVGFVQVGRAGVEFWAESTAARFLAERMV